MARTQPRSVLLVGCGPMAVAHAAALRHLGCDLVVVGRGDESAARFREATGIAPVTGGIEQAVDTLERLPEAAVVATPVPALAGAARCLMEAGVGELLVEKPAGLTRDDVARVAEGAERSGARVAVAYNRRFYASTRRARELIAGDGGATSFTFDFTELTWRVEEHADDAVKAHWFLANSTHVVDLALFLGGEPAELTTRVGGGLDWHPAARFTGAGVTTGGALFAFHADWTGPGRWGVEVVTPERRLVLCPLEELREQRQRNFEVETVALDDDLDTRFKPGLHRQMEAFLSGDDADLLDVAAHLRRIDDVYLPILAGVARP